MIALRKNKSDLIAAQRVARKKCPDIFTEVRTKPISQNDIVCAQQTFNEEALYQAIEAYAAEWHRKSRRPAKVLEMCSSTGLCALRVSTTIPVEKLTLVDIEPAALAAAETIQSKAKTVIADAVIFRDDTIYDLILLNSAYHHIPQRRKAPFMKNVRRHLAIGGLVLVGDHFLPPYGNKPEFQEAVVNFYTALIADLLKQGSEPRAIEIIRQAAFDCWRGITEYKVSWPVFAGHFATAGLQEVFHRVVWAPPMRHNLPCPVGSVAVSLKGVN